jgi:hypothetical protein
MRIVSTVVLVLSAMPLAAQSPFDGTWLVSTQGARINETEKYVLRNGAFQCDSCVPKESVKADGKPHKVNGIPDYDEESVREDDDHTVEITMNKGGKLVETDKMAVSDGTLRDEWKMISQTGIESHGTNVYSRVGEKIEGANQISGTWRMEKAENYSENAMTLTYKMTSDVLEMKAGTGQSFNAKLDGEFYPVTNSARGTQVSIRKIGADSFEQTDKRSGKVVAVYRVTVNADGKMMKIHAEDKEHNATYDWTAVKQ